MKKALTLLLAAMAVPASGQTVEVFELPEGCEAFMTVQTQECSVDHMFTCEGDPETHQRRVSITENGVNYLGTIDEETQWLESVHIGAGHREQLSEEITDRASFTTISGPNGSFDSEDAPVEFLFAGETGFLSANPKYGCGETLSSAPSSLIDRLEALQNEL